jgi:hypothetical protein
MRTKINKTRRREQNADTIKSQQQGTQKAPNKKRERTQARAMKGGEIHLISEIIRTKTGQYGN